MTATLMIHMNAHPAHCTDFSLLQIQVRVLDGDADDFVGISIPKDAQGKTEAGALSIHN